MEKNVGSVNLDELRAAREALDRERGVETDPNMYNNYDPDKHKAEREQEKLARMNESSSSDSDDASDVSADEIQEDSVSDSTSEPILEALNSDDATSTSLDFDLSSSDDLAVSMITFVSILLFLISFNISIPLILGSIISNTIRS